MSCVLDSRLSEPVFCLCSRYEGLLPVSVPASSNVCAFSEWEHF